MKSKFKKWHSILMADYIFVRSFNKIQEYLWLTYSKITLIESQCR